MARYRKFQTRTWTDEKFCNLTAVEKLIAIYCFTSPHSNRCGIYPLSYTTAAFHLGLEPIPTRYGIDRVSKVFGWRFDDLVSVVYIPTWWKLNPPDNSKSLKGFLSDLDEVPSTPLLREFFTNTRYLQGKMAEILTEAFNSRYPAYTHVEGINTQVAGCYIADDLGMPSQEKENEQENELIKGSSSEPAKTPAHEPPPPSSTDPSGAPKPAKTSTPIPPLVGPPEPGVVEIPCVGKGSKIFTVTRKIVAEFAEAYPGIDVVAELVKARVWSIANPKRQKTFDGVLRFLNTWLDKAQNQGHNNGVIKPSTNGHGKTIKPPTVYFDPEKHLFKREDYVPRIDPKS